VFDSGGADFGPPQGDKIPSGHWLMEEKPAETSAALKDFFGN